jgi:hypothetical protein
MNKLAVLAESFAQREDLYLQVVRADDDIRPDQAEQLVLGNERSVSFDEHHQDIERACAEFDRHSASEQSPLPQQYAEAAELERFGWARCMRDRKIVVHWLTPRFC